MSEIRETHGKTVKVGRPDVGTLDIAIEAILKYKLYTDHCVPCIKVE